VGHLRRGQQVHLLDADHQHVPGAAGLDRIDGVVEGDRGGGAGALAARHRLEAQRRVDLGGERGDVLLVEEGRRRAGADVNCVDILGVQAGIGDGAATGLDQQVVIGFRVGDQARGLVLLDEGAECGVVGADDACLAHEALPSGNLIAGGGCSHRRAGLRGKTIMRALQDGKMKICGAAA
jgi:hypothetical protein